MPIDVFLDTIWSEYAKLGELIKKSIKNMIIVNFTKFCFFFNHLNLDGYIELKVRTSVMNTWNQADACGENRLKNFKTLQLKFDVLNISKLKLLGKYATTLINRANMCNNESVL